MKEKYLILAICLVILFFSYSLGTPGDFFFDDYPNIVNKSQVKITELSAESLQRLAGSGNAGPLRRPIPMISFGLNHYFSGLSTTHFKITNILIHIFNGLLLFHLIRSICLFPASLKCAAIPKPQSDSSNNKSASYIALVCALLWCCHPIHVSGVLYIVQRMNLLAGTFSLIAIIIYCKARLHHAYKENTTNKEYIYFVFLLALSAASIFLSCLCKENGALTIVFIFSIELFLFRFYTNNKVEKFILGSFFCIFLAAPTLYFIWLTSTNQSWITGGYSTRNFDLRERLLTQSRLLIYYLRLTFLPSISELSFFHDDIAISKSITNPISTLFAIIFWVVLTFSSIILGLKNSYFRLVAFGVIWYLGGHFLESSIFALDMAYEHRNYMPLIGPIFSITCITKLLLEKTQFASSKLVLSILILAISSLLFITAIRSERWSTPEKRGIAWTTNHPNSAKSHFDLAHSYIRASKKPFDPFFNKATEHLLITSKLDNTNQISFLTLFRLYSKEGIPIKDEWLIEANSRISSFSIRPAFMIQALSMLDCHIAKKKSPEKKCVDPDIFLSIVDTAINGNASSIIKADLYTIKGKYYLEVENNISKAIHNALFATKMSPKNIKYHLTLARYLSISGNFKAAKSALELISKQRLSPNDAFLLKKASEYIKMDENNFMERNNEKK